MISDLVGDVFGEIGLGECSASEAGCDAQFDTAVIELTVIGIATACVIALAICATMSAASSQRSRWARIWWMCAVWVPVFGPAVWFLLGIRRDTAARLIDSSKKDSSAR